MLPTIDEIRSLERETLQVISQINEFGEYEELYELAKGYRTTPHPKGPINLHFTIKMDIRTRANAKKPEPRHIHMGLIADSIKDSVTVSNVSYSLAICKNIQKPSTILRKLHFDFEHISLRSNEPKPSIHMQIGGKLNPYMRDMGYTDSHVVHFRPDFEKPRIPSMPVCLAILIHWILLEFDSDRNAKKIVNLDRWKKHVAKAERIILEPYFQTALKFMTDTRTKERCFMAESIYQI